MNKPTIHERYDFPIGSVLFFFGALFVLLNLDMSFTPVTTKSDPWRGLLVIATTGSAILLLYAHWFVPRSMFLFGCGMTLAIIPRINWLFESRTEWMCEWFASSDFIWFVSVIGLVLLVGIYAECLRLILPGWLVRRSSYQPFEPSNALGQNY